MAFSQRRQLTRQTWSIVKKAGIALLAAQAAAVVTVHAIDRMRTARIPGGMHGFPTLPPADTQIGDTVTGAEKNADGTYTVTGDGTVTISAVRATRRKSWLSFADTSWYTGAEKTYTLTTAAQLAGLAKLVNEQGVSFSGVTVQLGADISLASIDGASGSCTWTAIGASLQKPFSGTFDGQGHTIFAMEAKFTVT